jgi:hypothetical protein
MIRAQDAAAAGAGAGLAMLYGPRHLTAPVEAVLASLALPDEPVPPVEVVIAHDGRRALGRVNGNELWSIAIPRHRWLEAVTGQIVATLVTLLRRLVFVHAAAVEIGGRALVLVGDSGAGKTSTAAALLARGGAYLSDEVALLDPASNRVLPFHLPMAIKPWTAHAAGPLPAGIDVARQDAVRFRLPDRLGHACPLGALVLLEAGNRPDPAEISTPRALLRLARQPSSFRYPDRMEDAFRAWTHAVRDVPCRAVVSARPAAFADRLFDLAVR